MVNRSLGKVIKKDFFKGKIVILVGARQVGKTTLVRGLLKGKDYRFFNGDDPLDRRELTDRGLQELEAIMGGKPIIFVDEAQKIENIGQTLKLLVDRYGRERQIIVTGSSSWNLLNNTQEALTGRKWVFEMFPLSASEMWSDRFEAEKSLEGALVYGMYPAVALKRTNQEKEIELKELVSSYLYKDIFEFQRIKNPTKLIDLVKALALQVGGEVSYTELGTMLGLDKNTVESYVDLMEKNFIVYRLSPYYSNKRKEISKLRKIYFYDLGIRNMVIGNLNPLNSRNDVGALWENFLMNERMKKQKYAGIEKIHYFWRSYDEAEVDLVEEGGGKIDGFEFKWGRGAGKRVSKLWQVYKNSSLTVINRENWWEFVGG
jgi:predicted AAA+ superfamily ATPase